MSRTDGLGAGFPVVSMMCALILRESWGECFFFP